MSASIKIKNLGPIKDCSMEIDDFTVLTGAQAAGKSTIAKCIYLFRTIKDDFLELVLRDMYLENQNKLIKSLKSVLRNKFLRIFGTFLAMSDDMIVEYNYKDEVYVKLSIFKKNAELDLMDKFVNVEFSSKLLNGLSQITKNRNKFEDLKRAINNLFDDEFTTVYIPAGRSLISLLTSQLNFLYITMDERQKRMMDYTTQKYIEYILKIRPSFVDGLYGLAVDSDKSIQKKAKKLMGLINEVLKGRYVYNNGTELLYIPDENNSATLERYVKINFTSSGQQESVWIFNILFYIFVNKTKAFIIIEEPEAHLYPDAQKKITEIIAFVKNSGCQVMLTTHSPYVLGSLNNLIYADYIYKNSDSKKSVEEIVDKDLFIDSYSAFQVEKGLINPCKEETDEQLIMNEVIDGVSNEINEIYDKLFDLRNE